MRKAQLALTTIGLIAGTRAMLGVGIGLLLAEKMKKDQRRTVGWTLLLAGAGATVPLVMHVLSHRQEIPEPLASELKPV